MSDQATDNADRAQPTGLLVSRLTFAAGEPGGTQAYLALLDDAMATDFLAPFAMNLALYAIGPFLAIRMTGTERRTQRVAERIAEDAPDAIHVQLAISGDAWGEAAGKPVSSTAGTIMLLDNRRPFVITDLTPRTVFDLTVPRHMIDAAGDPARWHGAVLEGGKVRLLIDFLRGLAATIDTLDAAAGPALAAAFSGLLAVAIGDEEMFAPPEQGAGRLLARAQRWVDYKLASPDLGPDWLARKLDVSRSELYAVMQPLGGVRRFIMARRAAAAHRALADPQDRRRIAEIAFAVGFQSEAHFSRTYKAQIGMTPSATRAAASA